VTIVERCRQRQQRGLASVGGAGVGGGGGGGGAGGGMEPRPRVQLAAHVTGGDPNFAFSSEEGDGIMTTFSITTTDAW